MALENTIETIESVSEGLRKFYAEGDDEKFHLDEALVSEVSGLSSALSKERKSRSTLEKETKTLKFDLGKFKDIDPEMYRETLDKLEALESAALGKKGKFNPDSDEVKEYFDKKTERLRADLNSRNEDLKTKLGETETDRDGLRSKLHHLLVTTDVDEAVIKAGIVTDYLDMARRVAADIFRIEDGKLVPRNADGEIMFGVSGNEPITPEEWAESVFKKQYPRLFEHSSGGGGGKGKSFLGTNKKTGDMTQDEKTAFIKEYGLAAWEKKLSSN